MERKSSIDEETFLLSLDREIISQAKILRASKYFNPYTYAYIDIDDLAQEGRIEALRAFRNANGSPTLKAYCMTSARGGMLHLMRSQSICSAGVEFFNWNDSPQQAMMRSLPRHKVADHHSLYQACRLLTKKQMDAIAFFFRLSLDGEPVPEPLSTHRSDHREAGLRSLRKLLEWDDDERTGRPSQH